MSGIGGSGFYETDLSIDMWSYVTDFIENELLEMSEDLDASNIRLIIEFVRILRIIKTYDDGKYHIALNYRHSVNRFEQLVGSDFRYDYDKSDPELYAEKSMSDRYRHVEIYDAPLADLTGLSKEDIEHLREDLRFESNPFILPWEEPLTSRTTSEPAYKAPFTPKMLTWLTSFCDKMHKWAETEYVDVQDKKHKDTSLLFGLEIVRILSQYDNVYKNAFKTVFSREDIERYEEKYTAWYQFKHVPKKYREAVWANAEALFAELKTIFV